MSDDEFDAVARDIGDDLRGDDLDVRIAAACRGSGNPSALAWLAEQLELDAGSRVVDLGSGLGGPAAWITHERGCLDVVAVEPAAGAAEGAATLFSVPVVRGAADGAPVRSDGFDAALLLGVLSVVERPLDALGEARRVATRVGVMEYCSTTGEPVEAGGSRFPTPTQLDDWIDGAGLVVASSADELADPPRRWRDAAARTDEVAAAHPEAARSEAEVVAAIDDGSLRPRLVIAVRG